MSNELYDKLISNKVYFDVRGNGREIDRFNFRNGVTIEENTAFLRGRNLFEMGYGSYTYSPIDKDIKVGRYTSIAGNVRVMGVAHPLERFSTSSVTYDDIFKITEDFNASETFVQKPWEKGLNDVTIEIGNDVWIGDGVVLGRKVKIGHGAVIATGSIVTKDVPPYTIVGGIPAKVKKHRFSYGVIKELLHLEWWNYDISTLRIEGDIPIDNFIEVVKSGIDDGSLKKLNPKKITVNR